MNWLETFYRWFGACILSFFAFAPLYVGVMSILDIARNPNEFGLLFVVVVSVCAALSYFLLLLAYRAATGQGRKSDGGLLPPLAMQLFVGMFGVIALCIVAFGAYKREVMPVIGGFGYMVASIGAWKVVSNRTRATQQAVPADRPKAGSG